MTAIYQFDPDRQPDSDFQAGELRFLLAGNRGRLLDARRTPITIVALNLEQGTFEVEIQAFEDRGARWSVPFEDVGGYQFAQDSPSAAGSQVTAYAETARRFDRPLIVEADLAARARSLEELEAIRAAAGRRLDDEGLGDHEATPRIAAREGDATLTRLLHDHLAQDELVEMDLAFSQRFVSNPNAGELVKGHAIVLAELGLCPYAGKVVRDPHLFTGEWTKQRRAKHLLARLAFMRALWSRISPTELPLHRAMASDGPLDPARRGSFVSATFSIEVATDHFKGGPTTRAAAILRQITPHERLFMTFLETPAMDRQFKEAEAILIGDPSNPMF